MKPTRRRTSLKNLFRFERDRTASSKRRGRRPLLEVLESRLALAVSPPPEGTGFVSHLYRFPVKRDLPTRSEE